MASRSQIRIEDLSGSESPREEKQASTGAKRASPKRTQSTTSERELRDRLGACFARIAEALERREDDELAEIVREDSEIMAQGLMSLTRPFRALRMPLLMFVAIVEPALAFGRILRVLGVRMSERRARIAAERNASNGSNPE